MYPDALRRGKGNQKGHEKCSCKEQTFIRLSLKFDKARDRQRSFLFAYLLFADCGTPHISAMCICHVASELSDGRVRA